MPRYSGKQLEKIQEERKQEIMQAALRIFSKRGINGTKISMISDEAGVSHGLFYHYFKSKEELFTQLIREAVDASVHEINRLKSAPISPMEKIKLLTEAILDQDGAPYFMLLHQARNADGVPEEAKRLIAQYPMEFYIDSLLPVFAEGQDQGEILRNDPEELIASYLAILSGVMVLGEGYTIPRAELLLRVIAP